LHKAQVKTVFDKKEKNQANLIILNLFVVI